MVVVAGKEGLFSQYSEARSDLRNKAQTSHIYIYIYIVIQRGVDYPYIFLDN